jgi:hypothetical protein
MLLLAKALVNRTQIITYFQVKYSSKEKKKFARRNVFKADLNLMMSYDNCLRLKGRWL